MGRQGFWRGGLGCNRGEWSLEGGMGVLRAAAGLASLCPCAAIPPGSVHGRWFLGL
jgi:hypothetical protein